MKYVINIQVHNIFGPSSRVHTRTPATEAASQQVNFAVEKAARRHRSTHRRDNITQKISSNIAEEVTVGFGRIIGYSQQSRKTVPVPESNLRSTDQESR